MTTGRLTTHVLDTARGVPGAGMEIELYHLTSDRRLVATARTNSDGRAPAPLLEGSQLRVGTYELVFHAGSYFAQSGLPVATPPFLNEIVIRFGIAEADTNYHVPLLVSPWSYTTYRGS